MSVYSWGLAFPGQSLLVASADGSIQEIPDYWHMLSTFAGRTGL